MTTPSARQARTTQREGQSPTPSSSRPPPPNAMQSSVDALIAALPPHAIDILKIEFSSDIRQSRRAELPEFAEEPVERYRLLLALDEVRGILLRELGDLTRKTDVHINEMGGIHTTTSEGNISHRNAAVIVDQLQLRMGVPIVTAHDIWQHIVLQFLLHSDTFVLPGLCFNYARPNTIIVTKVTTSA